MTFENCCCCGRGIGVRGGRCEWLFEAWHDPSASTLVATVLGMGGNKFPSNKKQLFNRKQGQTRPDKTRQDQTKNRRGQFSPTELSFKGTRRVQ